MRDKHFDKRLGLYIRSERALLDITIRNKLRQLFYLTIGFIVLLTALIMLDIGVFFSLKTHYPIHVTAFILAGSNLAIFILLLIFAKRKRYQRERVMLEEIRDYAKAEVQDELKDTAHDFMEASYSVKQFTHQISSIFSGEVLGLASLIPIIKKILHSKE